jgi:hypothetical protein
MQLAAICAREHNEHARPWIEALAEQIGIPADTAARTLR